MARWRDSGWIWKTAAVVGGAIVLLVAAQLFGLMRGAGMRSYDTPSGSMAPTLMPGDNFFAFADVDRDRVPPRGQVVVFTSPQDSKTTYVKRVVGLPGDRIQLRYGRLSINDQIVQRVPADPALRGADAHLAKSTIYRETLPGGVVHLIAEVGDGEVLDNTDAFVVPDGNVFMLGDNRDNSLDSRSFGFVSLSLLRDEAYLIFWSSDLSRIGQRIQ